MNGNINATSFLILDRAVYKQANEKYTIHKILFRKILGTCY